MTITQLIHELILIRYKHDDLPCRVYCCDRDDSTSGFVDDVKVVESDDVTHVSKHVFIDSSGVESGKEKH